MGAVKLQNYNYHFPAHSITCETQYCNGLDTFNSYTMDRSGLHDIYIYTRSQRATSQMAEGVYIR